MAEKDVMKSGRQARPAVPVRSRGTLMGWEHTRRAHMSERMEIAERLSGTGPLLMEGAVVERIRRGWPQLLDPILMNGPLIYGGEGRSILKAIYGEYLDIARSSGLPLLSLTPTWRTSPERLRQSKFARMDLNGDAVRFLDEIRRDHREFADQVYIGGLMGCRGDAYRPEEALSRGEARAHHAAQAAALAGAGPDYLLASTMPEMEEALGMAEAIAGTGCPYIVSFIIRPTGHVLDGTPLDVAMSRIEDEVYPRPLGYMVNCVHSSVLEGAFSTPPGERALASGRLLGLQANTSARSPEELDGLQELEGEAPAAFAAGMCELRHRFGLRMLGGCCDTDGGHMAALAAALTDGAVGR